MPSREPSRRGSPLDAIREGRHMTPRQVAKQAHEEIFHKKFFVLVAFLLVAMWLPGCGQTSQHRLTEARRETAERARKAGNEALKWKDDFLKCMDDYVLKNARASASATEIAEAAVSQCQDALTKYRYDQSRYHGLMYSLSYSTPHGILVTAHERGEEKARFDVQELIEEGKRRVINILVKIRQ